MFLKLTTHEGQPTLVNMDHVFRVQPNAKGTNTRVMTVVRDSDENKDLYVQESLSQILAMLQGRNSKDASIEV